MITEATPNATAIEMASRKNCTSSTITALHLVHIVFVVLVSVASALGNTWLFYLMLKRKKLRTIINVLLASLCATNIISSVLCAPVSLYRQYWGYSTWGMPVPFCNFYFFVELLAMYSVGLHVAAFACYRLQTILNPTKIYDISVRKMTLFMVLVWAVAISLSIPGISEVTVRDNHTCSSASCSVKNENGVDSDYVDRSFIVLFSIVYAVIVIASGTFVVKSLMEKRRIERLTKNDMDITQSRPKSTWFISRQQREHFRQFALILAKFLVCYTPTLVFIFSKLVNHQEEAEDRNFYKITSALLRLCTLATPIVIVMGCSKIRTEVEKCFCKITARGQK